MTRGPELGDAILGRRLAGRIEDVTARGSPEARCSAGLLLMPQFGPDAVGPRIRIPTLVVNDREDRINRFGVLARHSHCP